MTGSILRNSLGTLMLRGASFGVRVVCLLLVARSAGPRAFGEISVLFAMAEIARVVADAGVDTTMIRCMATQRGVELSRTLGAALAAKAVSGGLVVLLLLAAMSTVGTSDPLLPLTIACLAVTPLLLTFGANYFIATQRAGTIVVPVSAITALAGATFGLSAVLRLSPVQVLLVAVAYEFALGGWLVQAALRSSGARPILSIREAWLLYRTSLPFGVAVVVGFLYGKLDVFVIDRFVGPESVGQYSVWSRLLDPFLFVCGAVSVTAYGHLSRAAQDADPELTRALARRYARLNVSIAAGTALLLAMAGHPVARRFLPAYAESIWIGYLLAGLLALRSVNMILTAALQAAARSRLIMVVSLMNLTVALAACIGFARAAGVLGVVLGLVLMESLNLCVQLAFARRELAAGLRPPVRTVAQGGDSPRTQS